MMNDFLQGAPMEPVGVCRMAGYKQGAPMERVGVCRMVGYKQGAPMEPVGVCRMAGYKQGLHRSLLKNTVMPIAIPKLNCRRFAEFKPPNRRQNLKVGIKERLIREDKIKCTRYSC
jgi:hypothetical protein